MPIYAYRCTTCGHSREVLQKVADPVLVSCPACGADTFVKQVTAAGFQLKGSGWYATDFRGGPGKPAQPAADGAEAKGAPAADKPGAAPADKAGAKTGEAGSAKPVEKTAAKPADKPAAPSVGS
jgi:putative FmdB family regulatory protein